MTLRAYITAAFQIVPRPVRKRFLLAVLALATVSLLDLVALILVVTLTTLGTATDTSGDAVTGVVPEVAAEPLRWVGLTSLEGAVTALGFAIIVLFIGKAFLASLVLGRVLRALAREEARATSRLMNDLMHSPLAFHLERHNSEVMIDATIGMEALVMKTIAPVILIAAEFTLMLMLGAGLLVLAPVVAIGALLYFGAILWILHTWIGRRAAEAGRIEADSTMAGIGIIQLALSGFRDVIVRDAQGYFVDRFSEARVSGSHSRARSAYLGLLPRYFLESALVLGMAAVFLVQLPFTDFAGALSGLVLFAVAGFRLLPSLQRVQASASSMKSGQAAGERALRLLRDVETELATGREGTDLLPATGNKGDAVRRPELTTLVDGLRLQNVSFSYRRSDQPALRDICAFFPSGQMSALVGPSGSGKSTLIDVVLGLFDPDSGTVLADGIDIRTVLEDWRHLIGYVPQDSFLMPASIRVNVAFGVEPRDIGDVAVWSALRRASLAEFVERLPGGLDFELGDAGAGVSGGQRQRLSIARALYHDPQVLILDEATSSLDVEVEAEITQTLSRLSDLTKIVVAHRLSTVREAAQVLFMRDGRIEARGTFEAVRRAVPDFARQVQLSGLSPTEDTSSGEWN